MLEATGQPADLTDVIFHEFERFRAENRQPACN